MLKDDSNTLKHKASIAQTDQQQYNKDRTLFCINIDQKCTEDILYELFLQAGPIDNIVRKQDRNGNLICLITYKHIESCEYAIKMFNGISLFNQSLKVRPSDANSAANNSINTNSRLSQSNVNIYQRAYSNNVNRQNSNEKLISQPTTPQSLMMPPPLQLAANLNMISQALNNFSPQFTEFAMNNPFQHQQLNRSWSSSNMMNENDSQYHQSRRASNNNFDGSFNRGTSNNRRNDYNNSSRNSGGSYNDFNNSREFSKQSRSRDPRMNNNSNNEFDERQRSRSPIERNRKRNRR